MAESSWREELVPSLPWAHLAHNQFKSRLQNFSRILAVYPRVTGYLLEQDRCRVPCSEMVESLPGVLCSSALAGISLCTEFAAVQHQQRGKHRLGFLRTGNDLLCCYCY